MTPVPGWPGTFVQELPTVIRYTGKWAHSARIEAQLRNGPPWRTRTTDPA